jgi:hypothetical protein
VPGCSPWEAKPRRPGSRRSVDQGTGNGRDRVRIMSAVDVTVTSAVVLLPGEIFPLILPDVLPLRAPLENCALSGGRRALWRFEFSWFRFRT